MNMMVLRLQPTQVVLSYNITGPLYDRSLSGIEVKVGHLACVLLVIVR